MGENSAMRYFGHALTILLSLHLSLGHSAEPECALELRNSKDLMATGFMTPKTAAYNAGEAQQLLADEEALKANGFDVVVLLNPDRSDLEILKEEDAFYYGPSWNTWHQAAVSVEERINSREDIGDSKKKKKIADFMRKVNKSTKATDGVDISAERVALTPKLWSEYYRDLYVPWVVEKEQGLDIGGPEFYSPQGASKGELHRYQLILFRDQANGGKLVGGNLIEFFPDEGVLKIKFAAYSKEEQYRKLFLSYRGYHVALEHAIREGFKQVSYGSDPNFYGKDLAVPGLQAFKTALGFRPILWSNPDFNTTRIVKILNPSALGEQRFMFTLSQLHDGGEDAEVTGAEAVGLEAGRYAVPAGVSVNWR